MEGTIDVAVVLVVLMKLVNDNVLVGLTDEVLVASALGVVTAAS